MSQQNELIAYLGENSYPAIVSKIQQQILNTEPQSIRGKEFVSKLYESFINSDSPMLMIKSFTTNGEELAREDATIGDMLNFIKKTQSAGDFNYLINLAKEEHFANLRRNGITAPEKTIEDIKNLFDEPSNVIVEAIKKRMFDTKLNSQLYANLANEFSIAPETGLPKSVNKIRKLNESQSILLSDNGLIAYPPIAIKYAKPEQNYYVTPIEVLQKEPDWQVADISLPPAFNALQIALKNSNYSYDKNEFKISDAWDFDLKINDSGETYISKKAEENWKFIPVEDLGEMFAVSLGFANPEVPVEDLKAEADRFMLLANNYDKLVQLDELMTYQTDDVDSYNTVKYVTIKKELDKPYIVSTNIPELSNTNFETFFDLTKQLNESFNYSKFGKIFESQLNFEQNYIATQQEKINTLLEKQKDIDKLYESAQVILQQADEGSVLQTKANEEIQQLIEATEKNKKQLQQLNENLKIKY